MFVGKFFHETGLYFLRVQQLCKKFLLTYEGRFTLLFLLSFVIHPLSSVVIFLWEWLKPLWNLPQKSLDVSVSKRILILQTHNFPLLEPTRRGVDQCESLRVQTIHATFLHATL